jgi:hypothetical protein
MENRVHAVSGIVALNPDQIKVFSSDNFITKLREYVYKGP